MQKHKYVMKYYDPLRVQLIDSSLRTYYVALYSDIQSLAF